MPSIRTLSRLLFTAMIFLCSFHSTSDDGELQVRLEITGISVCLQEKGGCVEIGGGG